MTKSFPFGLSLFKIVLVRIPSPGPYSTARLMAPNILYMSSATYFEVMVTAPISLSLSATFRNFILLFMCQILYRKRRVQKCDKKKRYETMVFSYFYYIKLII